MAEKINVIAVHHGEFHADDVFAVAVLKMIYSNAKIIRTRNHDELANADMRVDVGMKYEPKTRDFDHHQPGGAGKRENGIPYSSVGLIWKHFGEKIAGKEVQEHIDKKIIQFIDAEDNGLDVYKADINVYTLSEVIESFTPRSNESSHEVFNKNFFGAVDFATKILLGEIDKAKFMIESRETVRKKIKESLKSGKEYIVLDDKISWKKAVVEESKLKFVVMYNPLEDNYGISAVPKTLNTFENRKDLPKKWGGLRGEELQKVTGIKDATFCHIKLFCAYAKTKESAIKMVEMALN